MLLVGRQTHADLPDAHPPGVPPGRGQLASSACRWPTCCAQRGRRPATGGTAKSVILLWLWGGPSQLDTFDPKPNAPLDYRGPFGTIPTRITGVRVLRTVPASSPALTDKLAVIRSLHTQSNDHGVAGTIGLTGSAAGGTGLDGKPLPGLPRPALGSVVGEGDSRRAARRDATAPVPRRRRQAAPGEEGDHRRGRRPARRARTTRSAWSTTRPPARRSRRCNCPKDLTPERLADRQQLLDALRQRRAAAPTSSRAAGALDDYRGQAFAMLTSPTRRGGVRPVAEKPTRRADRYGRTRFGQSCLLARRLVEAGVPFVQVNWSDHVEAEEDAGDGGWDHHYRNFQIMQDRHAPWLDQAMSRAARPTCTSAACSTSTLVLAVGEFGRAPKINDKAGREHWPDCYSRAGRRRRREGRPGRSARATPRPRSRADTPLTPADLSATVHHAVGLTSEQITGLGLTPAGRVIEELF